MGEPLRSPIARLLFHPATSILFATVGIVIGIIVIRNAASNKADVIYNKQYAEGLQQLSDLNGKVGDLQTKLESLRSEVSAIKARLPQETTTTISSSTNPSRFKEAVSFTAEVKPAPPDGGTIEFKTSKNSLGTATLTRGSATFTTAGLQIGDNSVTAAYKGAGMFLASKSDVLTQVVVRR